MRVFQEGRRIPGLALITYLVSLSQIAIEGRQVNQDGMVLRGFRPGCFCETSAPFGRLRGTSEKGIMKQIIIIIPKGRPAGVAVAGAPIVCGLVLRHSEPGFEQRLVLGLGNPAHTVAADDVRWQPSQGCAVAHQVNFACQLSHRSHKGYNGHMLFIAPWLQGQRGLPAG